MPLGIQVLSVAILVFLFVFDVMGAAISSLPKKVFVRHIKSAFFVWISVIHRLAKRCAVFVAFIIHSENIRNKPVPEIKPLFSALNKRHVCISTGSLPSKSFDVE